jgi:hypothetical protein
MVNVEAIFEQLENWWAKVGDELPTGPLYVFGSTVYSQGNQFDQETSDVDLATVLPIELASAVERTVWLEKLLRHKIELEQQLLVLLKRGDASTPIVSFVPVTRMELEADIHKSKVRDFFRVSEFLDVSAQVGARVEPTRGIPGAGTRSLSNDMVRQVIEHSQDIRNRFLAISAIAKTYPLVWSSDTERVPKSILRSAAQASSARLGEGAAPERFDVNVGQGELTSYIFTRRAEDPLYRRAYDWLIARTGGRGASTGLDQSLHLFFGEVLYDLSAASVTWDPEHAGESKGGGAQHASTFQRDIDTPASSENASAQSITQTTSNDAPIPVTFRIGPAGLLQGDPMDIAATLEEASTNVKWMRRPYFQVLLTELDDVETILAHTAAAADPASRVARAKAVDRKARLEAAKVEIARGVELLIFHQRIFFPAESTRSDDLAVAITGFSLLCLDGKARFETFGGPLEAWPQIVVDRLRLQKIRFGLPDLVLKELLRSEPDASGQELLWLAANNVPLNRLPQAALAAHFIPLLVDGIVKSGALGLDAVVHSDEELQLICETRFWRLGVI